MTPPQAQFLSDDIVIQVQGEDSSTPRPQAHLRLSLRQARHPIHTDLDHLSPYTRSTPFMGRDRENSQLRSWLVAPRPLLVRVITGGAGRGKTRLALELCDWAVSEGWAAGFVDHEELHRFLQAHRSSWGWPRPTLVVLDSAALHARSLAAWLSELACRETPAQPLRLLLLERHASLESGWCADVFSGEHGRNRRLLDPPFPVEIPSLQSGTDCIAIIDSVLGTPPGTSREDSPARSLLEALQGNAWEGDPLHLMMAALAHRDGDTQILGRPELALHLARREAGRIATPASGHADPSLALPLLAGLILTQGMRSTFTIFADKEKPAENRPHAGDASLPADLPQETSLPQSLGIRLPDLIGEAFLLHIDLGREVLLRCHALHPMAVTQTVVRCAQDFSPRDRRPLDWLEVLLQAAYDDEAALHTLGGFLSAPSPALGPLRLQAETRLAELRVRRPDLPLQDRAASIERLARAHASIGQHERALQAMRGAVDIRRRLAQSDGSAQSALARSLTTLCLYLSQQQQRGPALQAAQEAFDTYGSLAAQDPDAFQPELAMALANLGRAHSDLGQTEAALEAKQRAVSLYRVLAAAHPDEFGAQLAGTLSNLSVDLSAVGQHDAALATAEEAVEHFRSLAALRPDPYQPMLANTLSVLANRLMLRGERERSVQVLQESVGLWRALTHQHPERFTSHLALRLNDLANRLRDLDQREAALEAAMEAAGLYRRLSQERPGLLQPREARNLHDLACLFMDADRNITALSFARAAAELHRKLARAEPDAFRNDLTQSLLTLIRCYNSLGQHAQVLSTLREAHALHPAESEMAQLLTRMIQREERG